MKDFIEALGIIGFILGAISCFFCFIFGMTECIDYKSCTIYEQVTGRSTQYKIFGGCFIETESGWLTKSEYSQVIIAREGLTQK